VITGPGAGVPSQLKVFDGVNGNLIRNFLAFPVGFTGGIFVAAGDVNGDGIGDIVASHDSGAPPEVKVFDGVNSNLLRDFLAYDPAFLGGVRVAAGDVSGDGIADIITGPGSGLSPQLKVFDGVNGNLIRNFFAFKPGFTGGIYVAAGDVNGDGVADIVVSLGAGAPPEVKVFDGANSNLLRDFLAFDPAFTGGVRIAAADVNGDGIADIIAGSGPGIPPQIRIYDGVTGTIIQTILPFNTQSAGVYVAGSAAVTPTPTPTPTATPSATPTATATPRPSVTPRVRPTPRPRPTPAPRP
jgi:fibronectin-binding autotransporter adhesin